MHQTHCTHQMIRQHINRKMLSSEKKAVLCISTSNGILNLLARSYSGVPILAASENKRRVKQNKNNQTINTYMEVIQL